MDVTRRSAASAGGSASESDSQSFFQVRAGHQMSQDSLAEIRSVDGFSDTSQEEATGQR